MKTKTIVLNVTQEDIDSGTQASFNSCPVALALIRGTKEKDVSVLTIGASIFPTKRSWWQILLGQQIKPLSVEFTPRISKFIRHFDIGNPVKPFTEVLYFKEWN